MSQVTTTGTTALVELRHLLKVFGNSVDSDADRQPLPDLSRLDSLVRRVRDAGQTVTFDRVGETVPLAPGTQLAVFRVVQEALTNAIRHAPGEPVSIKLATSPTAVRVDVTNPVSAVSLDRSRVPGRGLIGMSERVHAVGGSIDTGIHDGAFRVAAVIPCDH
jgi:signal transduction histidine kinase